MKFSAMLRARRLASKAKANQSTTESEFDDDRDEMNPLERFLSDAGSVFSGAVTEAASMAEDAKSIISADLDEEDEDEYESKSTRGSKSKKDKSNEVVKVKGSPATLAKEIKKLAKLERQVEKAERDITKAIEKTDKELDKAEEEQQKSRRKIKLLTRKFELERFMHRDEEDFADEKVGEVLKEGGDGIKGAGESVVGYIPRLVGSVNRSATKTIFPHDIDADYE
jgi:hypothetical protein